MKPQWQFSMHGLRFGLAARRHDDFNDNNRRNVNLNRQPSNRLEMALKSLGADGSMKTYVHLFDKLCRHDNLLLAFLNAKKGKSEKRYVLDFEKNLVNNLYSLQWELLTHTYQPKPLTIFTVRDPKTRRISASDFRDRVVHHAVCNVIDSIFESRFICDTYANRKGKGTLAALNRFQCFLRKVAGSGRLICRERERVHSWLCSEMRHTALFRDSRPRSIAFHP